MFDSIFYITSEALWIDDLAIQQLHTAACLTGMQSVVGMPDLHPGRGYPVGAAFFSLDRFYPALVGNDIGCGMAFWQTDILCNKFNADRLEKRLMSMRDEASVNWLDKNLPEYLRGHPFRNSLGSIGGGNHFAELQKIDKVLDNEALYQTGINTDHLQLLIHSGSCGLGQSILQHHILSFSHNGLAEGTEEALSYMKEHNGALSFARMNRELIADRILQQLWTEGFNILDTPHNFVEPYNINGMPGWLHRKGATPDRGSLAIISGSRGDYSWLVKPVSNVSTLHSLAHGAGRKWIRSECKGRLSREFSPGQLARTRLGSRVICRDKQLIYEEAPQAYKPTETIIDCLIKAGLAVPVARLCPVLTLKTSGDKTR